MKILLICRSSCPQVFHKASVLKNFVKFTGKDQYQSLNEVEGQRGFQTITLLKKILAQVEIFKILKNTTFIEQLWTTAFWYIRISKARSCKLKRADKWLLTCFKNILKISHSNSFYFCSNFSVKFAIFVKSSLLFNSLYCFVYL